MVKVLFEMSRLKEEQVWEVGLNHKLFDIKFEIPHCHARGDLEQEVGYLCMEFWGKFWSEVINLRVICIQKLFKEMRLHKINQAQRYINKRRYKRLSPGSLKYLECVRKKTLEKESWKTCW